MKLRMLFKALWGLGLCTGAIGCVSSHQGATDSLESQDSLVANSESEEPDLNLFDKNSTLKPDKATIIKADLVRILIDSGFSSESVPKMVCTAKFESNFRLKATNLNRNGTRDSGIFQINDIWLNTCKLSREELMNPEANARCAFTVYKKQGLTAWVAYKKKRGYCQKYKLEPSLTALLPVKGQKPSS